MLERDGAVIDLALEVRMMADRLELRGEDERIRADAVVERLLTEAVAGDDKLFRTRVPQ